MTHLARIRNGVVVNVVVADEDTPDMRGYVPLTDEAWIGWNYADGVFTPPPEVSDDV